MTVRAINLIPEYIPFQLNLFTDAEKIDKNNKVENAVEGIRNRFGNDSIQIASIQAQKIITVVKNKDAIGD